MEVEEVEDSNQKQLETLNRGNGVLVKQKEGGLIVGEVTKVFKRRIQVATLEQDDRSKNEWKHGELKDVLRKDIVDSFPLKREETDQCDHLSVPNSVQERINVYNEPKSIDTEEGGENKAPPVDEQAVDEQAVDLEPPQADRADAEADLPALLVKIPNLPQNKSKNQIEATKEEIKSGTHQEADLAELSNYVKYKALGNKINNITPEMKPLIQSMGWRRTWKGEGAVRKAKSRLYTHGFKDGRDLGWLETYSGTMEPGLMRVALIYALMRGWKAAKSDVRRAFLQTPSEEKLYAQLPKDLPKEARDYGFEPGGVYEQLKALDGRTDSPRLFTTTFKEAAKDFGWEEEAECILIRRDNSKAVEGILFMHMDDLLCLSLKPEERLKELGMKFEIDDIEALNGSSTSYTGLDFFWDSKEKKCSISQEKYIKEINTDLTERQKKKVFSTEDLKINTEDQKNPIYEKAQQAWVGVLGWTAKTQPHLSVIFSECSRNNTRASESSVVAVKRACEYAKKTHRPLTFQAVKKPSIVWWVDASYNLRSCEGRVGSEIQIVEADDVKLAGNDLDSLHTSNLVAWRSKRCNRKLASTTSAETVALVEGVKAVPAYIKLVESLWGFKPNVTFVTDSQGLVGWLRTGKASTDPHMQGYVDLIKERVQEIQAEVIWIDGKKQRADRQTKFIAVR